jgi:hypothetical protein
MGWETQRLAPGAGALMGAGGGVCLARPAGGTLALWHAAQGRGASLAPWHPQQQCVCSSSAQLSQPCVGTSNGTLPAGLVLALQSTGRALASHT